MYDKQRLIKRLQAKCGNTCRYCGVELENNSTGGFNPNGISIEHKIPLTRGGTNCFENLTLSCQKCNRMKGSMDDFEFIRHIEARKRQGNWKPL